jgi:hypothetical protein
VVVGDDDECRMVASSLGVVAALPRLACVELAAAGRWVVGGSCAPPVMMLGCWEGQSAPLAACRRCCRIPIASGERTGGRRWLSGDAGRTMGASRLGRDTH